jgi:hypothetical protein
VRRVREQLAKLLESTRAAAQRDIPAGSLRDQLNRVQIPPLSLNDNLLFNGILELQNGGTNADFSATGPGVVKQPSLGAALEVGPVLYTDVGWASGSAQHGQPLLYDNSGPSAQFGPLNLANTDATTGLLLPARGGTGANNGSRTLAVNTNSGSLAFGSAGLTLTIPATGTAALLGLADQVFTENNSFAKLLRGHNVSGTNGYGIRIWDGVNDWGNLQALDLSGNSFLFFSLNRYWDGSAWQSFNTRVGSSFQVTNDSFDFYTFPVSSNVATSRFQVSNAGNINFTGYQQMVEVTAPAAGAANTGRLFLRDNGAGKTQLCIIFNTGAIQVLATQP